MKRQITFISKWTIFLLVGGLISIASSVIAQESADDGKIGGISDNPHLRPKPKASATAEPTKLSQADQKFILSVAASGVQEVQDGQVAQQRGNATTKNVASRIVSDRSRSNKELLDLAKKKGLGVGVDKIKARNMGGSNYDKQYIYSVTHDYEEDIGLFKKAASSSGDKDVKAWASKNLPTMQQHLAMLKQAKGSEKAPAKE